MLMTVLRGSSSGSRGRNDRGGMAGLEVYFTCRGA